jgi:uncharacterized protein YndB with AHSA1/START domain
MFQGIESIELEVPPEKVFAFVADLANDVRWMKMLASSRHVSAGSGVGSTWERTYSGPLGKGQVTRVTVESLEAPRHLTLSLDAGAGTGRIAYDLAARGSGTTLVMTTTLEHKGLLGLLTPLAAPMMRRADRKALAALKEILESRVSGLGSHFSASPSL